MAQSFYRKQLYDSVKIDDTSQPMLEKSQKLYKYTTNMFALAKVTLFLFSLITKKHT